MLCERAGIPETLKSLYARLLVVPPDTPLPMTMLKRLWNLPAEDKAGATASLMESKVRAFHHSSPGCSLRNSGTVWLKDPPSTPNLIGTLWTTTMCHTMFDLE